MKIRNLAYIFILILINKNLITSDGSSDLTFNGTGFVITQIGSAVDVWIQTNSKIVALGNDGINFVAARYNLDGSLDKANFGSQNGFIAQPAGEARAIIIQPDLNNAKILAVGNDNIPNFFIVRYNSDGSLDKTFGSSNGFVSTAKGLEANAIALQTDRKILAGGLDINGNNFFIARYNLDGSLDTSFGGTGFIIGPIGEISALAIQSDGKIIVVGSNFSNESIIARYNIDGIPDLTFGGIGSITFANANFQNIAIQPDGKIIASGFTPQSQNFILARFFPNGNLDTSFNSPNGFITFPPTRSFGLSLQPDGKIIATGFFNNSTSNFRIARYLSTGLIDTSFGSPNGFVNGPLGSGFSCGILPNGKIVTVGELINPGELNIVVALHNNNHPLVKTIITSPNNGSTLIPGNITFTGTAQNLSFVYLYLDGNFLAGFPTDSVGDTWSFTSNISSGTHTVQAVSIYNAGHVNFQSDPVIFEVGAATTTLFATNTTNLLTPNALAGNTFSYAITVSNIGTATANNVILTDALPNGLTYLSSSISNGELTSFFNNIITANIGTIPVGDSVKIIINVSVNQYFSGLLTNIAHITSSNALSINTINNTSALIPSFITQAIIDKYN